LLVLAEGNVQTARVVLSGVAPIPWRSTEAEKALVGKPVDASTASAAASAAVNGAVELVENGYKIRWRRASCKRRSPRFLCDSLACFLLAISCQAKKNAWGEKARSDLLLPARSASSFGVQSVGIASDSSRKPEHDFGFPTLHAGRFR
jgi:hypothetical protein